MRPPTRTTMCTLAVLACALAGAAPARASCGSSSCFLVTGTTEGTVPEGSLSFDLSFRFIPQSRRMNGRDELKEVLAPKIDFENGVIEPDHHREIRTQNTLAQLELDYGLTSRWTLFTVIPLINQRDHEHWDEVGTGNEFFTRDDGGSGFGDVRLGTRRAFLVRSRNLLVGSLGVEAPTGTWRLRDSEGEINEPSLQPGSGSWDWLASVYFAHEWMPHQLGFFAIVSGKRNGENDLDYRIGEEWQAGFGAHVRSGARVVWIGQVNARRTGRDRFMGERVPSTGSTLVNLTPGVRFESPQGGAVYLFVAVPVFQDVNESQLAPGTAVVVGISRGF